MKIRMMYLLLFAGLTSCQVYQAEFDCPPCRGVPCTSVSDIQKMIIETPEGGPDIFSEVLPSDVEYGCGGEDCPKHGPKLEKITRKRIWVDGFQGGTTSVEGHFIYFDPNQEECCQ